MLYATHLVFFDKKMQLMKKIVVKTFITYIFSTSTQVLWEQVSIAIHACDLDLYADLSPKVYLWKVDEHGLPVLVFMSYAVQVLEKCSLYRVPGFSQTVQVS